MKLDIYPSRAKCAQWIAGGLVTVDGKEIQKPAFTICSRAAMKVILPALSPGEILPDATVKIEPVYEDEELLVIKKPAGLVAHPGAGQQDGTLVNGLLYYVGEKLRHVGSPQRPGIVHRLDKDTSGLMLVAKTDFALQKLCQQFLPPRSIKRCYLALTTALPSYGAGRERATSGWIKEPIGRDPRNRKKMAAGVSNGKAAETFWELKEDLKYAFLLHLELTTGRTHQIRAHLHHQGAGIIGDKLYPPVFKGSFPPPLLKTFKSFPRQALHAYRISFVHPVSGKSMEFSWELPDDIAILIDCINRN